MLVLARKESESIRVGDDIRITITKVRGDKVTVGIDAPDHLGIHREEIYTLIQNEKRAADLASAEAGTGAVVEGTR